MKATPLSPEDKSYLREVVNSTAGRRYMAALIAMRPPISGTGFEQRGLSASEAMGYERAVSNMAQLLEDAPQTPELKSVNIRTD